MVLGLRNLQRIWPMGGAGVGPDPQRGSSILAVLVTESE